MTAEDDVDGAVDLRSPKRHQRVCTPVLHWIKLSNLSRELVGRYRLLAWQNDDVTDPSGRRKRGNKIAIVLRDAAKSTERIGHKSKHP
jgi:hypothetical protein